LRPCVARGVNAARTTGVGELPVVPKGRSNRARNQPLYRGKAAVWIGG